MGGFPAYNAGSARMQDGRVPMKAWPQWRVKYHPESIRAMLVFQRLSGCSLKLFLFHPGYKVRPYFSSPFAFLRLQDLVRQWNIDASDVCHFQALPIKSLVYSCTLSFVSLAYPLADQCQFPGWPRNPFVEDIRGAVLPSTTHHHLDFIWEIDFYYFKPLWLRSFSFITARDLFICTCFYGILIEGSHSFLSGQNLSQHRIQKETISLVYFAISLIVYKMSPLYLVVISAFVTRIWGSFSGLLHSLLFGLPSVCAPTISYLYSFVKQIW